jgi:hypothetical protein
MCYGCHGCDVIYARIPGKAWVAMALDVCIMGVELLAWREPHHHMLWKCGAVANGCHVLLCSSHVFVVCVLRFVVVVRRCHWPALVTAWCIGE